MQPLQLKRDGTLRLERATGTVVEVTKGQVWLTQERDPRDHFLRAGEWLRIDRPDTVVLSAVGDDAWVGFTIIQESAPGRLQHLLLLLAPGPGLSRAP